MWLDDAGRAHSIALSSPGKLLAPDLRSRIQSMGPQGWQSILDGLGDYLQILFSDLERLTPTQDEKEYSEKGPPAQFKLQNDEHEADVIDLILVQVQRIPIRWRSDVLFAVNQYVADLLIPMT